MASAGETVRASGDAYRSRDQVVTNLFDAKVNQSSSKPPEDDTRKDQSAATDEYIGRIPDGLVEPNDTPTKSTIPGGPHPRVTRELEEGGYAPWLAARIAPGMRSVPNSPAATPEVSPLKGTAAAAGGPSGAPEVWASQGKRSSGLMGRKVVAGGMVGGTVVVRPSPVEEIDE